MPYVLLPSAPQNAAAVAASPDTAKQKVQGGDGFLSWLQSIVGQQFKKFTTIYYYMLNMYMYYFKSEAQYSKWYASEDRSNIKNYYETQQALDEAEEQEEEEEGEQAAAAVGRIWRRKRRRRRRGAGRRRRWGGYGERGGGGGGGGGERPPPPSTAEVVKANVQNRDTDAISSGIHGVPDAVDAAELQPR